MTDATPTTPADIIAAGEPVTLLTGDIVGDVTLADGTVVDVSPTALLLAPERAYEVAAAIGARLAQEGHPIVGDLFVHEDTPDTNPLVTTED